ncbi:hypothetical protein [uncultured Hydrogenophaga sp.]|uniref:hypothetical protein n=1 Tax=uncultured Hydrogenophaga sp. TaxID=199683 RepID=UPI002587125D|nr:hypothetical protein [uncultured Hydrogenophaga sp.]
MARSSIQGASPAPAQPAGRDTASLDPGDSSDSGSDMMGIADSAGGDPGAPADFSPDAQRPALLPPDALDSSTDAAGTGEGRSAGGDGGKGDGWDIGTDQVITPEGTEATDEDEDPDLAFTDEVKAADLPAEDEDDEDESGANEGDGTKP